MIGPNAHLLDSTHDHAPCSGCVRQSDAIGILQRDLCAARGRIADLETRIERMGATPEMGRRKWNFEEGK